MISRVSYRSDNHTDSVAHLTVSLADIRRVATADGCVSATNASLHQQDGDDSKPAPFYIQFYIYSQHALLKDRNSFSCVQCWTSVLTVMSSRHHRCCDLVDSREESTWITINTRSQQTNHTTVCRNTLSTVLINCHQDEPRNAAYWWYHPWQICQKSVYPQSIQVSVIIFVWNDNFNLLKTTIAVNSPLLWEIRRLQVYSLNFSFDGNICSLQFTALEILCLSGICFVFNLVDLIEIRRLTVP